MSTSFHHILFSLYSGIPVCSLSRQCIHWGILQGPRCKEGEQLLMIDVASAPLVCLHCAKGNWRICTARDLQTLFLNPWHSMYRFSPHGARLSDVLVQKAEAHWLSNTVWQKNIIPVLYSFCWLTIRQLVLP